MANLVLIWIAVDCNFLRSGLKDIREIKIERPQRAKLSAKEVLKRMEDFPKRKEHFIAAVRKRKN